MCRCKADQERKWLVAICDAYRVANNRQRMAARELLSGSECQKPSWFLDMTYQTCFVSDDSDPFSESEDD